MTNDSESIMAQCAAGVYPADLVRWLAGGELGVSSNTIVQYLTCLPALGGFNSNHPNDPADLAGCRKLLEAVPWLQTEFPRMASRSDVWARLVDNWDDLCRMMDNEAPEWRKPTGCAPVTYARMREIIERESHEQDHD